MKNVYYFPHDFNASQDQKLIKLQREMGGEGLAIYWKLIERLGPETGHQLPDEDETYVSLEWDFHFSADKIHRVVSNYGLFVIEDGCFYSKSLKERLRVMEESKERRARAGSLGGKAKAANQQNNSNAIAEVEQCYSSRTQNCSKENKEIKEIKENKENKESKENNIQQRQQQRQQEKKNQKVEEVDSEGGGHNWSEKVTDEEYLGIVSNMMRKLAIKPCDEADGLIDMMHPSWKGQYDDFFENKKDATGLWTVERKNKYANAPRASVAECRNIDAYVDIVRRARIYDKWLFNAYRGLAHDKENNWLRIYVVNEKAAHYIETYAKRIAPILKDLYGDGVHLEYIVYSK